MTIDGILDSWVRCLPAGLPARVPVPGSRPLLIRRAGCHPILGEVDEIASIDGRRLTVCGRLDWDQPTRIPPLWQPGLLPRGAGTAILNRIAERASGPLRYRGPYPSAALFNSLTECFRTTGTLEEFTADADASSLVGAEISPPVEFRPAPFTRTSYEDVCAQVRDGKLEAVFACGERFSATARRGRRLVENGDGSAAVFEVGGRRVASVVCLTASGRPLGPPQRPAPIDAAYVGQALPPAVCAALWQSIVATAPRLLVPSIEAIRETPVRWGDCGLRLASASSEAIEVHAAFVEASLEGRELLAEIAAAVTPVVRQLAQRYAEAHVSPRAGS